MWIITNTGFVSIVEDRIDESMVYIRSRRESDLKDFLSDTDYVCMIVHSDNSDYDYRAHLPKSILRKLLAKKVDRIDYTNFKESVPKQDFALKDFTNRVWTAGFLTLKNGIADYLASIRPRNTR